MTMDKYMKWEISLEDKSYQISLRRALLCFRYYIFLIAERLPSHSGSVKYLFLFLIFPEMQFVCLFCCCVFCHV